MMRDWDWILGWGSGEKSLKARRWPLQPPCEEERSTEPRESWKSSVDDRSGGYLRTMALSSLPLFAALAIARVKAQDVPAQAQIVDQRTWNVLPTVLPSTEANGSQIFQPPNVTPEDLLAKPFHIYDDEFYSIIGTDPTLTLLAETDSDPLFHEAVVW